MGSDVEIAYSPESSLGWLDLDSAASDRVATLLRALEEPGTLDSLGFGPIRDGFSDLLHPGTSTVQTRLRYFMFLPWIFQQLEQKKVTPGAFPDRLRDAEARLIDRLRHLGPDQGVIGFNAGRNLKRLPSEAYWGGLGSWNIRRLDLSRAQYGQRLAALAQRRADRDDDGNAISRPTAMWAPLPPPPEGFLQQDLSFDLSRGEAELLVDHIRRSHPHSLLAHLAAAPHLAAVAERPWDVPVEGMSPELQENVHHARCFSDLTVGPQHLYNLLLARRARDDLGWDTTDLENRVLAKLGTWADRIERDRAHLEPFAQDIADERSSFWMALAPVATVPLPARRFLSALAARAVQDPGGFAENTEVHDLLVKRELGLKAGRARLSHRSALEGWGGRDEFGGRFTYRWSVVPSYMADLAAGLSRTD